MKTSTEHRMKFPCDCISSTTACEEPWARVAKEGMFKDGTREEILNLLHEKPRTIAQIAKVLKLAQPTIFRHVGDLVKYGLLREFDPDERDYVVERYYKPNFPVISANDQRRYQRAVKSLSAEVAKSIAGALPDLQAQFPGSDAEKEGWTFEEFAQYLVHDVTREARKILEEKGLLASSVESAKRDFVFWARE